MTVCCDGIARCMQLAMVLEVDLVLAALTLSHVQLCWNLSSTSSLGNLLLILAANTA